MTKRTIALLAFAFAFACPGSANAATRPAALSPSSLRTVRFIIDNDTGGTLKLGAYSPSTGDSWRESPGDIATDEVGDYTLTGHEADVDGALSYWLPQGDYTLEIDGDNPLLMHNHGDCEVQQSDEPVSTSPFECDIREDKADYNDTNFYVDVTRKGDTARRASAVPAPAGASSAHAATTPSALSLRTARFIVDNDTGGPLELQAQSTVVPEDSWRQLPGDIADQAVGDYTVTASTEDVGAALDYALPGGDYALDIYGINPLVSRNRWDCEIKQAHKVVSTSPFTCSIRQDKKGYNDTNFSIEVARKPGVARAARSDLAGTAQADTQLTTRSALSLRTARFIISNQTDDALILTKHTIGDADSWRETPGPIAPRGVGDYTLTATNNDVSADLKYSINSTADSVDIYGSNPVAWHNASSCAVTVHGTSDQQSPFLCSIREDKKGYNDTNFYVDITAGDSAARLSARDTR